GDKETVPAKLTLMFVTDESTTNYGDDFFKQLKEAKNGEYIKIEIKDKGIYLIQKLDQYSDDSKKYRDTREACIGEMVEDEYKELLNKKADTMEFVYNEKAIEKYSLDNLITLLNS
ncbi:MAG: hypothetical protein IKY44_00080, partial [Clostridia bacterium]|nr:hypothetical protein [Clostridia bacterium]